MNAVTLSGTVAGDSELRIIEGGRELLNFQIMVDGRASGDSPTVHAAFFPRNGDVRELAAGQRVFVTGGLRHRRDVGGLFIAAREIFLLATAPATVAESAVERCDTRN